MAKFDVLCCFGVDISFAYFDLAQILDVLGCRKTILQSERVKGLIKKHGTKHHIVGISMRQTALLHLKPALESKFQPYDSYFDEGALHGSTKERLYDAEERFLQLCLSIATGKSVKSLRRLNKGFNSRDLRDMYGNGRSLYNYFRRILNDSTRDYILDYKSGRLDEEGRPLKRSDEVLEKVSAPEPRVLRPAVIKQERGLEIENTPFAEEVETALKLYQDGGALLQQVVDQVKRGEQVDISDMSRYCDKLIASHSRNSNALLAIRHIKEPELYMTQHAIGAAVLACHLAKALQLADSYIQAITLGALLFDIGRFKLPLPLINKTGKLSESEFSLIRKHVHFGEQMLQYVNDVPSVVYKMLWDHHEKVDGTGYPNGKVDEEISVYGKIGAIVDAYDSMTSEQIHKTSMGPIAARAQIKKEAGLAFDRQLAALFLKSIGQIPVGSCVQLSNGRIGFVLTLNRDMQPSTVRQVYSLSSKTFITDTDIQLDKSPDISLVRSLKPESVGLQFINHIAR